MTKLLNTKLYKFCAVYELLLPPACQRIAGTEDIKLQKSVLSSVLS